MSEAVEVLGKFGESGQVQPPTSERQPVINYKMLQNTTRSKE